MWHIIMMMLWVVDRSNKVWKEDNDHNNLLGVTWHYVEVLKRNIFWMVYEFIYSVECSRMFILAFLEVFYLILYNLHV